MYNFTQDWFSHNLKLFNKFLTQFKDKKVKFLEIGSYEGRSAIWMLENILSKDSELILVEPGYELTNNDVLKENIKNFVNCKLIEQPFEIASKKLLWEKFDFVYIDGNHSKYNCYLDCVLGFHMLKYDGILAIDDYGWDLFYNDGTRPKEAIDKFLNNPNVRLLHKGYQVWITK